MKLNNKKHKEQVLLGRLARWHRGTRKDFYELDRIITELEKLYDTVEPADNVNPCKTCLFQKMCTRSNNPATCGFVKYNESLKELFKRPRSKTYGALKAVDTDLQYWNDTQEQLDKRFILS